MFNWKRWQSHVDKEIEKAIGDGKSEHLPGAGKPLNLGNDPHVPDDMKLAYKIMKENDIAPEWIMMGKTLERKEADLHNRVKKAVDAYRRGQVDAKRAPANMQAEYLQNVEKVWQAAQKTLAVLVDAYNNEILTYNLKVPPAVGQRRRFDLPAAINRTLHDRTMR